MVIAPARKIQAVIEALFDRWGAGLCAYPVIWVCAVGWWCKGLAHDGVRPVEGVFVCGFEEIAIWGFWSGALVQWWVRVFQASQAQQRYDTRSRGATWYHTFGGGAS